MTWKPDKASEEAERLMEAKDLPEEERDELRRFAAFLSRKAALKRGEALPPAPEGMAKWLMGGQP